MSDLIADAEDLLSRIGRSPTPEVRALMDSVQLSLDRMTATLRSRARRLSVPGDVGRSWTGNPWVYLAAGASLVMGIAVWRSRPPRS